MAAAIFRLVFSTQLFTICRCTNNLIGFSRCVVPYSFYRVSSRPFASNLMEVHRVWNMFYIVVWYPCSISELLILEERNCFFTHLLSFCSLYAVNNFFSYLGKYTFKKLCKMPNCTAKYFFYWSYYTTIYLIEAGSKICLDPLSAAAWLLQNVSTVLSDFKESGTTFFQWKIF